MRGDDDLRPPADKLIEDYEEGELPARGKGGFRFVDQIETGAAEAVREERKEGLAVRLFMQGAATVRRGQQAWLVSLVAFQLSREIEERLRPHEVAVLFTPGVSDHLEGVVQRGLRRAGGKPNVAAASLRIEARRDGDRL